MIEGICIILVALIAMKAIFIGSDFGFMKLFKHGKNYIHYYNNRPKFNPDIIYKKIKETVYVMEDCKFIFVDDIYTKIRKERKINKGD